MAHTLITQVQQGQAPATGRENEMAQRPSFFARVCPCFGGATPAASNPPAGNGVLISAERSKRMSVPPGQIGPGPALLPAMTQAHKGRKCLVLDLDETLVHSSFKPVPNADFVIPVEIDDTVHQVYVLKRPGVDTFMQRMGSKFEVVVFTASLSKYADPVLDLLDIHKACHYRLFREHCVCHKGNYVKDLGKLGRPLSDIIIIDNSPVSYLFNPENAMPIESWFDDPNDTDLLDLIPFLEDIANVDDVRKILAPSQ